MLLMTIALGIMDISQTCPRITRPSWDFATVYQDFVGLRVKRNVRAESTWQTGILLKDQGRFENFLRR